MDLSKHILKKCIDFIEEEGYSIKHCNYCNYENENTYTLLYICDVMDTKLDIQYNQYYECNIANFNSFAELEIQLNIWNHGSNTEAIGIFHQNTNITNEYNFNNFNTYLTN